jgi:hypothetical protein
MRHPKPSLLEIAFVVAVLIAAAKLALEAFGD